MEELNKILPYFIGLWSYQVYWGNGEQRNVTYCITLLLDGRHTDTKDFQTPSEAVQDAIKIIKDFENEST
jgi:hypothetical protein